MPKYLITYTQGNTPGPFNIFLSGSGTLNLYASNVAKTSLESGYVVEFPDGIPSSSVVISNAAYGCSTEENLPFPAPTPSVTPTMTVSPSKTPSVTITPSITATPSVTPTVTPTITPTKTVTPSISISITPSPTFGLSPSITPTPTITRTPSITPSSVVPVSVSAVGGGFSGFGSNFYVDGYITLSSNVSVDSIFSVDVAVSFGTVNVSVTVYAGNNVGSGTTYIGGNDPEPIGAACIVSCDNPSIVLTGFTC